MNTEYEIGCLERKIEALQKQIALLKENAVFLDGLKVTTCFDFCGQLNLQPGNRDETMEIVKQFPGKWNKSYRGDKVDYSHDNGLICIYGGQAPDTCRVVEEEVVVPEHREIRKRLVCVPAEEEMVAA